LRAAPRRWNIEAMRNLWWLVPIAVFFLNPSLACSDEPQFQYGAEEMRAAVAGDWSLTITPDGGSATQVTVHVDQAAAPAAAAGPTRGLVRAAQACGVRTLVKSAGACIDWSEMPLAVGYVSGDSTFTTATLSGQFRIFSLVFDTGDVTLTIGPYQVLAQVKADGALVDPHLGPLGTAGTVTISR
jgi:hypothetical protein